MSSRPTWTEPSDEWGRSRHRIELVAPRLWALIEERPEGDRRGAPSLVTTSASLKSLQRTAERREVHRQRRRRLWKHAVGLMATVVGLGLASGLPPGWMLLSTITLVLLALRALTIVIHTATNSSWIWVKQTYQ